MSNVTLAYVTLIAEKLNLSWIPKAIPLVLGVLRVIR